jgi:hypothetical protein
MTTKGKIFYNYRQRVGDLREFDNKFSEPIRFESTRTSNILPEGEQYYITIAGFRISNGTIPIMRIYPDDDPRYQPYRARFRFDGNIPYEVELGNQTIYFFNYDSINLYFKELLRVAWEDMVANQPVLAGSRSPALERREVRNNEVSLFLDQSIFIHNIYLDVNPNFYLKYNFARPNPTPFTFLEEWIEIIDPNDPIRQPIDPPVLGQYKSFEFDDNRKYQDEFRSIILLSNGIPIDGEQIGGRGSLSINVLSDFTPAQQIGRQDAYIYKPFGRRRSYKLNSRTHLRQLDIDVRWTSTIDKGEPNILFSPINSVNTLRIEFSKEPDEI